MEITKSSLGWLKSNERMFSEEMEFLEVITIVTEYSTHEKSLEFILARMTGNLYLRIKNIPCYIQHPEWF